VCVCVREREREGRRERDESRNQIKNISVKSDRENKIIIINLSDRICKKKKKTTKGRGQKENLLSGHGAQESPLVQRRYSTRRSH